jgi:hypothetical protein
LRIEWLRSNCCKFQRAASGFTGQPIDFQQANVLNIAVYVFDGVLVGPGKVQPAESGGRS